MTLVGRFSATQKLSGLLFWPTFTASVWFMHDIVCWLPKHLILFNSLSLNFFVFPFPNWEPGFLSLFWLCALTTLSLRIILIVGFYSLEFGWIFLPSLLIWKWNAPLTFFVWFSNSPKIVWERVGFPILSHTSFFTGFDPGTVLSLWLLSGDRAIFVWWNLHFGCTALHFLCDRLLS